MSKVRFLLPISDDTEITKKLSLEDAEVYFDRLKLFAEQSIVQVRLMREDEAVIIASGALSDVDVLEKAGFKRTAACLRALEFSMQEWLPDRKFNIFTLKYVADKLIAGKYDRFKK
jgi:hypothetical protein